MIYYIRHISNPVQHETGFALMKDAVRKAQKNAHDENARWLVCHNKSTDAVVWPDGGVDYQPAGTPLPERLPPI